MYKNNFFKYLFNIHQKKNNKNKKMKNSIFSNFFIEN